MNVVGVHIKTIIFACILIFVGIGLFFYGNSMSTNVLDSEGLISGTYLVVLGIFLAIAGFLVLVSQIFRGHSMVY